MAVVHVYKPLGWTPLQAIARLRVVRPELAQSVMTYAGRLDPMAEGVLVVLTDVDRYQRTAFLGLPKVYLATVLFGYASDTYDALGMVTRGDAVQEEEALGAIESIVGPHTLALPPYSAYVARGKPLHWWARNGRLHEIEIPHKHIEVLRVDDVSILRRPAQDVLTLITQAINRVHGDFRQEECVARWRELLAEPRESLCVATCTMHVTSGTYIRALAEMLGARLGCGALLLHLQRVSVGEYRAADAVALA